MKREAPIWVVRMKGRSADHKAAGGTRVNRSAYILVDDADGRVIAFGSSSPRNPRPAEPPFLPPESTTDDS
jgi:hypothetical protein